MVISNTGDAGLQAMLADWMSNLGRGKGPQGCTHPGNTTTASIRHVVRKASVVSVTLEKGRAAAAGLFLLNI